MKITGKKEVETTYTIEITEKELQTLFLAFSHTPYSDYKPQSGYYQNMKYVTYQQHVEMYSNLKDILSLG